ncbi:putative phosphatase [Halotydeus destructor]|nr:putative phosphatase [Halotydeus destructor]
MNCVARPQDSFVRMLAIPLPAESHMLLDEDYLSTFDEIVVIGDVHGCFDEMSSLMKKINKDDDNTKSRVLKIFVGDLVDKGPDSGKVVQYVMQNSDDCLSVRGNHENKVIKDYLKKNPRTDVRTTSSVAKDLNDDEIGFLMSLPYTISIPSMSVTIVHAGLIPGLALEENNVKNMTTMRNLVRDEQGNLVAVETHSPGKAWAEVWSGPQFVYFGHDSERRLQRCDFATGVDTGCVYGDKLTGMFIKGPRTARLVSVRAKRAYAKFTN